MSNGSALDHRRSSYDGLLATALDDSSEVDAMLPQIQAIADSEQYLGENTPTQSAALKRRAFFIRSIALLCACSLSIGSHYASYILGPLKSRLSREIGTSHTEFSLLISAFSLNSTWTPLVGGLLASTLGTTYTSILATGVIFLGQILLLIGDIWGNVRLMTLGLFVFGLGVSPLAVVQETIIVRFFKSHGLGVSMALGLVAGKGASFISARTSYPLTEQFGTRAPFYVATFLAGMSVVINLVYIGASKWLVDGAGAELEAHDISEEAQRRANHSLSEAQALEKVAAKRRVNLRQITKLGDVFWAYIALNILCGMIWSPFTHLAANIIETRYQMTEENAANHASYLLAGSVVLYPICGLVVDRNKDRPIVVRLMALSSILTLLAYIWLALPPSWTKSAAPTIVLFGAGHGFAPLLLVVLVPKIVALKYVSTALGVHKSLEQTGSTIFQTLAGLALDTRKKAKLYTTNDASMQHLLNAFVLLNVLHLVSILMLSHLQHLRQNYLTFVTRHRISITQGSPISSRKPSQEISRENVLPEAAHDPALLASEPAIDYSSTGSAVPRSRRPLVNEVNAKEIRRGEVFAFICAALIVVAWVLFMGTAWFRLGMKKGTNVV